MLQNAHLAVSCFGREYLALNFVLLTDENQKCGGRNDHN